MRCLASSTTDVFIGFNDVLYRSSNFGNNWIQINNGLTGTINSVFATETYLFTGTSSGVYRSSNNGSNWVIKSNGLSGDIQSFSYNGIYLFASGIYGVFRSSNYGESWDSINDGFTGLNASSIMCSGNYIFAGNNLGLFYSENNGLSWMQKNEGFEIKKNVKKLYINDGYLFAGIENSSGWKREISELIQNDPNDVSVIQIVDPVHDTLIFSNCYPEAIINPKSLISNNGTNNQLSYFEIKMEIKFSGSIIYTDSKQDTLSAGLSRIINFTPYSIPANSKGIYTLRSWTELQTDTNVLNDVATTNFSTINPNLGGGASEMGYFFANSTPGASCAPDQPFFYWEDTTGSVSLISNGIAKVPLRGNVDEGYFLLRNILPPGYKFQFDGICYDSFGVSTNGIVCLGSDTNALALGNAFPIPANYIPKPAIFAFWYDLDFSFSSIPGRNLKYKITNDKIIITYDRVPSHEAIDINDYVSFQVILEITSYCGLNNGIITVQFDETKSGSTFLNKYFNNALSSHSVGIQNSQGNKAVRYRCMDRDGVVKNHGSLFSSHLAVSFGPDESVLPVELVSFTSLVNENNVILNWKSNTESNNSGFNIERSSVKDQWSNMGFIKGSGNTNSVTEYVFTDKDLVPGKYNYRLKQIDYNGSFEYLYLTSEVIIGVPEKYELSQNYPNPFNPVTNLEFGISELGFVSLKVYDVLGKEVKTLVNEIKPAGRYRIEFDGNNFASGVYFYELRSRKFVSQKRMLLLK